MTPSSGTTLGAQVQLWVLLVRLSWKSHSCLFRGCSVARGFYIQPIGYKHLLLNLYIVSVNYTKLFWKQQTPSWTVAINFFCLGPTAYPCPVCPKPQLSPRKLKPRLWPRTNVSLTLTRGSGSESETWGAKLCVITTTNDFSRKQGAEPERTLKITTATTEAKRTALAKDYVVRSPQRAGVTNRNVINCALEPQRTPDSCMYSQTDFLQQPSCFCWVCLFGYLS